MRLLCLLIVCFCLLSACSKKETPDPSSPDPIAAQDSLLVGWQVKQIDSAKRVLNDVVFTSSTTGFTCGNSSALFKTTDGGTTWQTVPTGVTSTNFDNIQFLNTQYGFIAAESKGVLRTTDGGISWQASGGATIPFAIDMFFLNPATGFCTSSGGLYKSIDSGKTWAAVTRLQQRTSSLWFTSATKGFVTSSDSGLMRTIDGGNTFSNVVYMTTSSYLPIYFANTINGCSGLITDVYITNDGGTTWPLLKKFADRITDVKNTGPDEYYVISGSELWHTTNAGSNWLKEIKVVSGNFLVEFTFTQPGHVWATSINGSLYYK